MAAAFESIRKTLGDARNTSAAFATNLIPFNPGQEDGMLVRHHTSQLAFPREMLEGALPVEGSASVVLAGLEYVRAEFLTPPATP